jgi:hypothetical protein
MLQILHLSDLHFGAEGAGPWLGVIDPAFPQRAGQHPIDERMVL